MPWLKIDDGFVEHEKVLDISDRAFRLHMAGLCFCARNLTDGKLVPKAVKAVCAITLASRKHLTELRNAGLWIPQDDGWEIKDYLDYNPTAAEAKELKEKRAEAGRQGGIKSGEARRSKSEASASGFGGSKSSSNGVEPRPVPSRKELEQQEEISQMAEKSLRSVA